MHHELQLRLGQKLVKVRPFVLIKVQRRFTSTVSTMRIGISSLIHIYVQ